MTDVQIYAGTLTASQNDRSATGLLVPFGEECSSNLGRFRVDSAAFSVPADLTGLGLNIEHERENVVGAVSKLAVTDQGVVATFSFAKTPEGDQALADARAGKRRNLSAEVAGVVIQGGRAIAGRIFGAALVKAGAFPSATLLAAAVDVEAEPAVTEEHLEETFTDENGVKWTRVVDTEVETDENKTTTTTVVVEETEEPEEPAESEEEPVGAATVPNTLVAKASTKKTLSAGDVFDMITSVRAGSDHDGTLLAALTDIKTTGTGMLPVGGTAIQPAWLGEIWAEKTYDRRYFPLILNGSIQSIDEKGFVIDQGAELVAAWAGNKTELPSSGGTTSPLTSTFQRWAWAADIAREYFDIPSARPVIEAFLRKVAISYARVTDKWVLQQLVTAAGTATAAATFPSGYSASIGKLIQAIDTVDQTDIDCTWAIVHPAVYRDLRFTPKDLIPEYVTFGPSGADEGTANGGSVRVISDKFAVLGTGQVLAGGREVAHVNELPGASPLQLDALDIAKGGVDKATVGYTQYMTEYAAGLELVGVVA